MNREMASNWTIDDVKTALAAKKVSARELTADFFKNIGARNKELNAYLALSPERAYVQADKIDALVATGKPLPPLAGVPVAIKDVLSTRGITTTCGSKILEHYVPPYDATVVTRLEEAGAVILGKTNCDEFAMGSSNENSAYGAVKNPVALDRVPGGSSGGSAAVVAAGLAVASLGTDTGGSIRQPGALCGIPAMMGSYGRVSRYGLIAFASSLDRIGPFARTVEDAATVLGVIAGHDPLDATSSERSVPDYVTECRKPMEGLRVGVPAEYFAEGLDAEVKLAVEKAIESLRAQGCVITPVSLPHTRYAVPTYYVLATAEASSNLSRFDGVRYGHRSEHASTLASLFRESREEGFGAEVKRRILLGTYALSAGYYDAYYKKAQQVRTLLAQDFLNAFNEVDAIVTPMTPAPPFKLGEKTDDPLSMYLADIYTVAASLAGVCGISVPCGVTSEKLPIGVQILGKHFDEPTLLRVAQAVEAAQKSL